MTPSFCIFISLFQFYFKAIQSFNLLGKTDWIWSGQFVIITPFLTEIRDMKVSVTL